MQPIQIKSIALMVISFMALNCNCKMDLSTVKDLSTMKTMKVHVYHNNKWLDSGEWTMESSRELAQSRTPINPSTYVLLYSWRQSHDKSFCRVCNKPDCNLAPHVTETVTHIISVYGLIDTNTGEVDLKWKRSRGRDNKVMDINVVYDNHSGDCSEDTHKVNWRPKEKKASSLWPLILAAGAIVTTFVGTKLAGYVSAPKPQGLAALMKKDENFIPLALIVCCIALVLVVTTVFLYRRRRAMQNRKKLMRSQALKKAKNGKFQVVVHSSHNVEVQRCGGGYRPPKSKAGSGNAPKPKKGGKAKPSGNAKGRSARKSRLIPLAIAAILLLLGFGGYAVWRMYT